MSAVCLGNTLMGWTCAVLHLLGLPLPGARAPRMVGGTLFVFLVFVCLSSCCECFVSPHLQCCKEVHKAGLCKPTSIHFKLCRALVSSRCHADAYNSFSRFYFSFLSPMSQCVLCPSNLKFGWSFCMSLFFFLS